MIVPGKYIDDGLISERVHPEDPDLKIYNYTPRVQFERLWDDITLSCRGLIVRDGEVVARPFRKFFNLEELKRPPGENVRAVYSKVDGSLGISYMAPDGQWALATRGAFESEQAIKGTEMLRATNPELMPGYTYLFEIVYPENRVVVDYGDDEKLVLLAVKNTQTGLEPTLETAASALGFETPASYDPEDWMLLRERFAYDGGEGFVVLFENGDRVKLKYEQYTRMHRALSELVPRRIWEYLSTPGLSLSELAGLLPDEAYERLRVIESDLRVNYEAVRERCHLDFRDNFPTRKDAAVHFTKCKHPSILFAMLDGKDIDQLIWKAVKP